MATPAPSSGGSAMDPISQGVGAATAVAQTISNIVDQTKRRQFQQSFDQLSLSQQNALNLKMLSAQTDTDRMSILSSAMVQYAIANQQSVNNSETKLYFIAGGLAVVLIGAAVLLSRQKN